MLQLKNYCMEYIEGKRVIDNLNMTIREGDIYAFVGRNGVGKTTTIKSIVGINHITEGDILLDKISIQKNPIKYKKMLAYVPDNPILYEYLTGIQYLDFIADIYEMTSMEREKVIEKYDSEYTLIFLDPPYYGTAGYEAEFGIKEQLKLRDILKNIKGKFILTINDCEETRSWYKDFNIKEVEVHYSVSRQTEGRKRNKELIITNY